MNSTNRDEGHKFGVLDPHLGFSDPVGGHEGYTVFPTSLNALSTTPMKIMLLGGSTTAVGTSNWWRFLHEELERLGVSSRIYNGASPGYFSGQEVIKLLRDIDQIGPDFVISFSGINDIEELHKIPKYPYVHNYQLRVLKTLLTNSDDVKGFLLGTSSNRSNAWHWVANMKKMRALTEVSGGRFIGVLQPTMVIGDYQPSDDEKESYLQRHRTLRNGKTYEESAQNFYVEVRSLLESSRQTQNYIFDYSELFSSMTGLYRDYRHQNSNGDIIIARRLATEIVQKDT